MNRPGAGGASNWKRIYNALANDGLPEPQDLASEAITELEAVVDDLGEIIDLVEKEEFVENKLGFNS